MRRSIVAFVASALWAVSAPSLAPWQPSVAPQAAASATDRLVLDGDTLVFSGGAYRDYFPWTGGEGCYGPGRRHPLIVDFRANRVAPGLSAPDSLWLVSPRGTMVTRVDAWSHEGGYTNVRIDPGPQALMDGDTVRMILRLSDASGPRFIAVTGHVFTAR